MLKTGRPKRKISLSEHCRGKNLLLQEVRIIGKKITLHLFFSEMISKDQDLNSEQQTAFGLFTTFNPKNNKRQQKTTKPVSTEVNKILWRTNLLRINQAARQAEVQVSQFHTHKCHLTCVPQPSVGHRPCQARWWVKPGEKWEVCFWLVLVSSCFY